MDAVRHNRHRMLRVILRLSTNIKQRDLDQALMCAVKTGLVECTEVSHSPVQHSSKIVLSN